MANYYPTLTRGRASSSFRGDAPRAVPYPRSGELFPGIPKGFPDRFGGQYPTKPFGRKAVSLPRQIARIRGLWRLLAPTMGADLLDQVSVGTWDWINSEGVTATDHPGAGFQITARCVTALRPDRKWGASFAANNPSMKGFVNACYQQTGYLHLDPFYLANWQFVRGYGEVTSLPHLTSTTYAKPARYWERPVAGAYNPDRSIHINPEFPEWQRWDISPALAPLAYPMLQPITLPAGQEHNEVLAWPMVDRLNAAAVKGTNPWVMREVGPALTLGRAVPAVDPERLAPVVLAQAVGIVFGNGGVVGTTAPHQDAPPPPGAKERKLKTRWAAVAKRIGFNAVTEFGDFVGALHDALPAKYRRSRTWRDKNGKWHKRRIDSMLRDLFLGWEAVDLKMAFNNIIANEIEDLVIGTTNKFLNRGSQSSGWGLGTQLNKWAEGAGMETIPQRIAKKVGEMTVQNQKNGRGQSAHRAAARAAGRRATYQRARSGV